MPGTFVAQVHAATVLVPLMVAVAVVWLLVLGHRLALTWGRALTALVATAYGVGVLAVTFFPWQLPFGTTDDVWVGTGSPPSGGRTVALRSLLNVVPIVTADPPTFLLNIVMTLPLGALLPLLVRVRSVAAVALVGLAVSASIEVGQGVGDVLLGMSRTVDVNDLVANVSGTVLGLLVLRAVTGATGLTLGRFALPGSAVARRLGRPAAQTGARWLVDDEAGASTATTPAPSSAVPKTRFPSSA